MGSPIAVTRFLVSDSGNLLPAILLTIGLGSNRSMWLGPPSMNRKITLWAVARWWPGRADRGEAAEAARAREPAIRSASGAQRHRTGSFQKIATAGDRFVVGRPGRSGVSVISRHRKIRWRSAGHASGRPMRRPRGRGRERPWPGFFPHPKGGGRRRCQTHG